MKIRNVYFLAGALLMAGFLLNGCEKSESSFSSDELQVAQDDALLDAIDQNILTFTDQYDDQLDSYATKSGSVALSDTCPIVTHYFSGDTMVVTIDFGTECTDSYGNTRSGEIIIKRLGRYREQGFFKNIYLQNFYFNGNKVEGTHRVENMGQGDNGHYMFSVSLEDGKITTPDSVVITHQYTRNREWIVGYDTKTPWDDEYLVTGSATGIDYKGLAYTRTIVEPLYIKMACRFIVSGVIQIEVEGQDPVTIDYGNGDCDNAATLSNGNENREMNLKMNRIRWRN